MIYPEPKIAEMTPKQALKFIKDAKKLGVTSGKLGTLEFVFITDEPRAPRPALKVSKKAIGEIAEQNELQEQFDKSREDLSTLHLADPAAFEQAMIERELAGDDDGGEKLEEAHALST